MSLREGSSKFLPALLLLWLSLSPWTRAQTPEATKPQVRFVAMDVFVDSQQQPLAAYQLEFSTTNRTAKIVGIEGGEHSGFSQPPFYDPKAMQQERVIIAAFNTNAVSDLPVGKIRVATIHLQASGIAALNFKVALQVAADSTGTKIAATAVAEEGKTK